jgi:nitroimidazol reductase NimA-like FMN-containing flavoprotein (pyridoxamine 5'-phosphate oxidase superfamily)
MDDRISKAQEIISKIIYITIASADNGQPWNSPVYSAYDENYNFYWVSDRNGQHSRNIRTNENIFIVIYDSTVPQGTGEGVYIKAKALEVNDRDEAAKASRLLAGRKNKNPRNPEEYLGAYPRRVYKAIPEKVWMNGEGELNGNYIDTRFEVDLLG